jgi:hypothetical protein
MFRPSARVPPCGGTAKAVPGGVNYSLHDLTESDHRSGGRIALTPERRGARLVLRGRIRRMGRFIETCRKQRWPEMREWLHVEIAAPFFKEEVRCLGAACGAVRRNGSQSISRGKIQGSARLGRTLVGNSRCARLSALSTDGFLASRQHATHSYAARMQTRFSELRRGHAHEHARRRIPLRSAVPRTKPALESATLLELVRINVTRGAGRGRLDCSSDRSDHTAPAD